MTPASIPRSFYGNSNHFPDTVGASPFVASPAGSLTLKLVSFAPSFFGRQHSQEVDQPSSPVAACPRPGSSPFCMSRTPLVIATTASCSGTPCSTGRRRRRLGRRCGGTARTGSRSPDPSRSWGCAVDVCRVVASITQAEGTIVFPSTSPFCR